MLKEARRHVAHAAADGFEAALRPNGTSDLPFEKILPELFGIGCPVYDYTKSRKRALDYVAGRMPGAYHLTYSASERDTVADLVALASAGLGIAVVFDSAACADVLAGGSWLGFPVIDGDESDARYLDRQRHGLPAGGYFIALRAKGKAKRDTSGFVRRGCGGAS